MNVDDVVAAKVEAARVRIQAAKRRRDELAAARKRGLAARHANKLRRIAAQQTTQPVTTDDGSTPTERNS
ncbi:hypothetical protein [Streptomyces microflavus]|uniref:hypothetical protein n=1 Tax=Streptomyces microflavus TaxID=1919 RepID=UPI0034100EAF